MYHTTYAYEAFRSPGRPQLHCMEQRVFCVLLSIIRNHGNSRELIKIITFGLYEEWSRGNPSTDNPEFCVFAVLIADLTENGWALLN